ncbi:MAG TPA: HEAT repeat domain-containing protein, partial [Gemmatales bacterium]|nr:HEAT repeat domain-containing protein [Gemmatales bacterium]
EEALGDPHLPVVASAAESLGSLDFPAAAPILAGLLRHHADVVRQAASTAIEQNPSRQVLPAIFNGLDDPVANVRFSLVAALGKLGQRDKLEDSERQELLRRLERVLVLDTDPGVRSRAATVLGDLGDAGQLPLLWQRTRATEDNRVQLKAWQGLIDILARLRNPALVVQWEQLLAEQGEPAQRIELFTELRDRWSKLEASQPLADIAAASLVRALLADRKWSPALPIIQDLTRRADSDGVRLERLRWMLVACTQALDDKQPQEVLKALKLVEEMLPQAKELAAEFAELRRKALEAAKP